MIQSYPLILEGIPFRSHGIVGIYPFGDKVAILHMAFGKTTREEYDKGNLAPRYVLLDTFSSDFNERQQAYLTYFEQELFSSCDAVCYWDNNNFLLNTKRYIGFSQSIAKLIQITDTNLAEIGDAPAPVPAVYNDQKIYTFGEQEVSMSSKFIMECRESSSKLVLWRLKLSAYLYTQVEEENGILYFGTAGNGGRFYGVNAADGTVIFNCNTGGTVSVTRYKEHILLADRQGKPVLLNPKDGTEVRKIEFGKFKFTADQIMLVIKDKLYAIASGADAMYAVCADLTG